MKRIKSFLWGLCCCLVLLTTVSGRAEEFRVASYNVENLFDLAVQGEEYPGYVPLGRAGWDEEMFETKLRNISEVISDLDACIVGLQEVESRAALEALREDLAGRGTKYKYSAIASGRPTSVRVAVLSRFPIKNRENITVLGWGARDILMVELDVYGHTLYVFVNHWHSKNHPESTRVRSAKALKEKLGDLPPDAPVILLGDFNSEVNETELLEEQPDLNDTGGRAGINQVLGTWANGTPVNKDLARRAEGRRLFYNLWLEKDPDERWTRKFYDHEDCYDHILVSGDLLSGGGPSYVEDSFDRFDPWYLFDNGKAFRWQRRDEGKGKHVGEGYSDHFPVHATFSTESFDEANTNPYGDLAQSGRIVPVARLYDIPTGRCDVVIENCVVLYRHRDSAIVKEKDGRGIYVYRAAEELEPGSVYDLHVRRVKDFHGLREIVDLEVVEKTGRVSAVTSHFLQVDDQQLDEPRFQGEVVRELSGDYRDGYLHYGDQEKIYVYFRRDSLEPEEGSRVTLKGVRVAMHGYPQLVVEKAGQIVAAGE